MSASGLVRSPKGSEIDKSVANGSESFDPEIHPKQPHYKHNIATI